MVFFLHDLLPIYYPEYFKQGNQQAHNERLDVILKYATHVVMNSEYTHAVMCQFRSERNCRCKRTEKTAVIHPGIDPIFLMKDKADVFLPLKNLCYFLIVGTIEPRKNHVLLLNIWRSLIKEWDSEAPNLVIFGRRGWENENVIDMLERCQELRGHILELPGLDDFVLSGLLMHCRALLCPSLAEGWGMPVPEALAMGTPVICSDIPALRESGQGIPEYLDPMDGMAWKKIIRRYATADSPERRAQLERLKHFKTPTWTEHFSKLSLFVELPRPPTTKRK